MAPTPAQAAAAIEATIAGDESADVGGGGAGGGKKKAKKGKGKGDMLFHFG
jgi:hypothetical protein